MTRRIIYLIDTENVGMSWLDLIKQIRSKDIIYLFYTENSFGFSGTMGDIENLLCHHEAIQFVPCHTGKNALDFQLVSYLGFLLKKAPKTQYYIYSSDIGYDALVKFWMQKGYCVDRLDPTNGETAKKREAKARLKIQYKESVLEIVSGTPKEEEVCKIVTQNKENLQKIHTDMVRLFGQEKADRLYKEFRPKIKMLNNKYKEQKNNL